MNQILFDGIELKERYLCYDGDMIIPSNNLIDFRISNINFNDIKNHIYVDDPNHNDLKGLCDEFKVKTELKPFDLSYNIPNKYQRMDIIEYTIDKLQKEFKDDEYDSRLERVKYELDKFIEKDLTMFIRTVIYIVDVLNSNNIVWGVGRGSSVSSFVLYLIGIHDIDSYKYKLSFDEFIK